MQVTYQSFCFSWLCQIVETVLPNGSEDQLRYIHPSWITHIVILLIFIIHSVKPLVAMNKERKVAASQLVYNEYECTLEEIGEVNDHFVGIPIPHNWHPAYQDIMKVLK